MEKAKGVAALIFVTILAVVLGVYSYRLVTYVHHNWAHIVATSITIAEWGGGIAFILILAALKGNGSSSEESDSEPQASPKSNFKPSLQLHSVQVLIPGSVKYTTRRSQSPLGPAIEMAQKLRFEKNVIAVRVVEVTDGVEGSTVFSA